MAQYLYRIRPTRIEMLSLGPTEDESRWLSAHFSYLKDLIARGVVILAGPTLVKDETNFGIVVFQAESDEAARAVMNNDPAVLNHVMQADLFPFRVSLIAEANAVTREELRSE